MSIIFYHDEEQRRLAEESRDRLEASLEREIATEIVPAGEFYLAEAYHQKYYLQQNNRLLREFEAIYPDLEGFINSTAVARANGYVGGNGSYEQLQAEIDDLGLSEQGRQILQEQAKRWWP
jgi:peptide-methionine (S)-S-oxide reductase